MTGGGVFYLQPHDKHIEQILASEQNNKPISGQLFNDCLKATFESSRIYGLFSAYFDDELYNYADSFYNNNIFASNRPLYTVLGITRVLEDVEISKCNLPLHKDIKSLLEQDFCEVHVHSDVIRNFLRNFSSHSVAKIIIYLDQIIGTDELQLLSLSDAKAIVSQPDWLQTAGLGYQIDSCVGKLEIVAKAIVNGKVKVILSGPTVPRIKTYANRVPCWVDYTRFTVNGKNVLNTLYPAWNDNPYRYDINVKAGDEIKIQVEWLPHKSDT